MNQNSTRWLAGLFSVFALAGAAIAAEQTEMPTAVVEVKELRREIRLDGIVEAVQQATVAAQTRGQVEEVLFDVDDYVEEGQLIVRLKSTEQTAGLTQAQAEVKAAKARLNEAEDEYKRIKDIFEKKLVSASEMDKASAALKTAKASYEATSAAIKQAEEQVQYTQVRAPYSGIVTERHVELGEIAQPGQPLMTGISLDKLRVLVDVPQRVMPGIREYKSARVLFPDGEVKDAEKLTIFPIADTASNTFKVRLDLPEGSSGMFPGMFVKVAFQTGLKQELLVPENAVVYRSEVTGVYVIDEQGGIHFRHMRLGQATEFGMVVLAGLNPGEKVSLDPIAAGVQLKSGKAE